MVSGPVSTSGDAKGGLVLKFKVPSVPRAVPGEAVKVRMAVAAPDVWLTLSHTGMFVTDQGKPSWPPAMSATSCIVALAPGAIVIEVGLTASFGGETVPDQTKSDPPL